MDLVIDRLDVALASARLTESVMPARSGFQRGADDSGVFEWMPYHRPGSAITLKAVSYTPTNPVTHRLPTILSTIARFDDATGRLLILSDGVLLTAIRTGAASAVASRLLARTDSRVLGLIGAGAQAVTQAHALSRVLALSEILVFDTDRDHLASFAARIAFTGLTVRESDPFTVASSSDVICTATSVAPHAGPVLPAGGFKNDVHINAIGADLPGKVELARDLLHNAALICADHVPQALREGECQQLRQSDLGPDLAQLCTDRALADTYKSGITIFDSTGMALEDHVVLDVFAELAAEEKLGIRAHVEHLPDDCLDPYAIPAGFADDNRLGVISDAPHAPHAVSEAADIVNAVHA